MITTQSGRLRNNRGNVLLQVLAATAVMSISFYFLTNYVIGQKKQISKTVNAVSLRFALNSTMDYVIFGVRQKYCFTNDGLLLRAPTCTLTDDGSVERLIMSTDQENFIKMMHNATPSVDFGAGVDYNNLSLKEIHRYLKAGALSASHPLVSVMQKLRNVKDEITGEIIKVDGVKVDIYRDDSLFLPRSGREVYLKINLSLMDTSNRVIYLGSSPLTLSSSVAIYPREVGSFALLIPNDLHLDLPYNTNTGNKGDVVFHQFDNRKAVGGPGLTFLSPVFVNRDIYLPEAPNDPTATPDNSKYAAVTFADRVVMGNGWLKTSAGQYTPRTAGSTTDRLWADSVNFGGFLKGVENDGGVDKGLQVFGGVAAGTPPDTNLMAKCIQFSVTSASMNNLKNATLGAKITDSNTSSSQSAFTYRMFFTVTDFFNPQTVLKPGITDKSQWGSGVATYTPDWSNLPVFDVVFAFGDKQIEMQMPFGATAVLTPETGSPQALANLQSSVDSAKKNVDTAQANLDSANSQLTTDQAALTQAKSDLAAEEAKPPVPNPLPNPPPKDMTKYQDQTKIDALNAQIASLNTAIASDKSTVTTKQTALDNAQTSYNSAVGALNNYKALVAVKPEITLSFDKVRSNKADLNITAKNVNNLIDQTGNWSAPSIKVKAYDNTYYQGIPVNPDAPPNTNLQGYLNFTMNSDNTQLVPPAGLASSSTNPSMSTADSDTTDYDTLQQQCAAARSAADSQSFGGASWTMDFSGSTRHSWNFAGEDDSVAGSDPVVNKTWIFDSGSSPASYTPGSAWPEFQVKSIVKECIIESSATFVTGFFACDSMTIKARSTPLRIIGSFIVGKLIIDPSAYKAGITWSSIYHPQATRQLRAIGILHPSGTASCDITSGTSPVWHPIPSVQELSNRMTCNAISLRAKADPFRWTAVDPDCGMPPAGTGAVQSNTTCKHRLIRFYVVEQSREEGLTL